MKKTMILIPLICAMGYGNDFLREGTFKTVYYYENNFKIAEKRVEECKTLNEMTFAIEKDCDNAKTAFRRSKKYKDKRNKASRDFINQSW